MKIVRKNENINKKYEDINIGEVFVCIADGEIYMKTEHGALDLESGFYYTIEDYCEVELLDVELHVL